MWTYCYRILPTQNIFTKELDKLVHDEKENSDWLPKCSELRLQTLNIAKKKTVCFEVQTYYLEHGKKFLAFGLLTMDFGDALIYSISKVKYDEYFIEQAASVVLS